MQELYLLLVNEVDAMRRNHDARRTAWVSDRLDDAASKIPRDDAMRRLEARFDEAHKFDTAIRLVAEDRKGRKAEAATPDALRDDVISSAMIPVRFGAAIKYRYRETCEIRIDKYDGHGLGISIDDEGHGSARYLLRDWAINLDFARSPHERFGWAESFGAWQN